MPAMRYQPQGGTRLAKDNPLLRGGPLAVVTGSHSINLATGAPLKTTGQRKTLGVPGGMVASYRKDWYQSTEAFPTIGTQNFVMFWYGVPSSSFGTSASQNADSLAIGSTANQMAIATRLGADRSSMRADGTGGSTEEWGALYNWDGNPQYYSAGEVCPKDVPVKLIVVRNQSGMYLWRDGKLVASFPGAPRSLPATALVFGAFIENDAWRSSSDMLLAGFILGDWTGDQVRSFSANPWQLFWAPHEQDESKLYTLTAAAGSFVLNAAVSGLQVARRLAAAPGAMSVAGSPASLLARRAIAASVGLLRLTGRAAGLVAGRRIAAVAGTYDLAGAAVPLLTARRLSAATSAFGLAGGGVQMVYTPTPSPTGPTYTLTVASGGFALAGVAVRLGVKRRLAAAVGGYALQGVAVQVRAARRVVAQPGTFVLAGAAAGLKYTTSGPRLDISQINPARISVFPGSGSRVAVFEGSGSRVAVFDGSGSRVTRFQ